MNFFGRARLARQHHAFLREVDLYLQLVHRYPILQVPVEPVGLFNQQHANGRMRLQVSDHFAEGCATNLFGRFNVDVFLRHYETVRCRILLEQL
jgi:hypothetical protein